MLCIFIIIQAKCNSTRTKSYVVTGDTTTVEILPLYNKKVSVEMNIELAISANKKARFDWRE